MVSFRSVFDDTYGRAWRDLTGGGGGDRNAPRHPGYQGPGAGYGEPRDEGFTWFPNAGERILRDHPLDSRGLPTGFQGQLPHTIAPQVQAVHDQAIWEENRRIMQDAVRGSRAAAGLLQSFRPGGGAAIESGIYSQMAGLQMQRASMNKPLDLLGDFRREQDSRARRQSNRANERSMAVQGIAALAGIVATAATGGAAAPLIGAGISALGTGYAANQNRRASEAQARAGYDAGAPGVRGPAAPGEQAPDGQFPTYTPGGTGAPSSGYSSSGIDPATGGMRGTGLTPPQYGPPAPGGGAQATIAPDSPMGGPGAPQGQPGAQGGQDSGGGGIGAGGPVPGSDGNFMPVSYAADSVRQPAMQNPIVRLVMADTMVNMVEESGIIPAFTFAADRALAKRLAG